MRRVLIEDVLYSYLQKGAKERLKTARQLARNTGLDKANVLLLKGKTYCIFPWMGTKAYRTLARLINLFGRGLDIRSIGGVNPYFLTINLGKSNPKLHPEIVSLCQQKIKTHDLVSPEEALKLQKYDEFIPVNLLHKAFAIDYLDVVGLKEIVSSWY
jgi:ATP-dependent Lhr-like helicase